MEELIIEQKSKSIYKFSNPDIKVLLMLCIKRRIKFILKETKYSIAEFCRQSGINIAYAVYILKMNTKITSDNVVRHIAIAFEINSFKDDFDYIKERVYVRSSNLKSINTHALVDNTSLWRWAHKYNAERKYKESRLILNAKKSMSVEQGTKIHENLEREIIVDHAPTQQERKFNYNEAMKSVQEHFILKENPVQKQTEPKVITDKQNTLLNKLVEEEADLLKRLKAVRSLLKLYQKESW